MAGFRLRKFIIALALFGAVSTGILAFVGDVSSTYDTKIDTGPLAEQAQDTFRSVNRTRSAAKQQANAIGGGISAGAFILKSVWDVIALTFSSLTTVSNLMGWLEVQFGFPNWFVSLVVLIVTVLVAYEIVTLYRGIRT